MGERSITIVVNPCSWNACWPRPIFMHERRRCACCAISARRSPRRSQLLKKLAADEHPRVRLEAVRAASFFTVPEAVEVPVIAAELPGDEFLTYVRGETMQTLNPYWNKALADHREVAFTTAAGARYLLRNMPNDQLLKQDLNRAVCLELLTRAGIMDDVRREAVRHLAELDKKSELAVLIDAIHLLDAKQDQAEASVVFDLVRLISARDAIELASASGIGADGAIGAAADRTTD